MTGAIVGGARPVTGGGWSHRIKVSSFMYHSSQSLRLMNEYLVVDNGGYLFPITLCALLAAWLNAAQMNTISTSLGSTEACCN